MLVTNLQGFIYLQQFQWSSPKPRDMVAIFQKQP